MRIKNRNLAIGIIFALFVLNFLAWIGVYALSGPPVLEVNFFDVGQGDSIFIETPQRHQILIDGGPSSVILEKLAKQMPFWDRTIDLIVLTHPEKDHMAGFIEVLKRYRVENILWTGVIRNTPEFQEWQAALLQEKAKVFLAQAGQKIIFGKFGERAEINVLYPFDNLAEKEYKDSNNTSIVLRLVFGSQSFLFTGDIYKSVEKEFLKNGVEVDSDILKVGHHGSKTSSAQEFIEQVSPQIGVIMAGLDNSYGHPHQATLEIFKKYGIKVLRTDINGDIKIKSDGKNYISNF